MSTVAAVANSDQQCWQCRRRRVRCDSERPECRKCRAKGLECPGYGESKPLVWVFGASARKKRQTKKHDDSATIKSSAEVREPIEDGEKIVELERTATAAVTAVDDLNLSCIPDELASQVRCFEYYNRYVFPTTCPINTPSSPLRINPKTWHSLPAFFHDIFILVVSRHELVSSRCSGELVQRTARRRALELDITSHGASAYRLVNMRLSNGQTQLDDFSLVAVFMFMLSEIQQSGIGRWKIHLEGVRTLIKLRGGIDKVVKTSFLPHTNHLLAYFVIIDIMRLTTSVITNEANAASQIEYLQYIPDLLSEGFWTCFPCPEELVCVIVHVNELRLRSAEIHSSESNRTFQERMRDLCAKLDQYESNEWANAALCAEIRSSELTIAEWNTRVFSDSPPPEGEETKTPSTVRERELRLWKDLYDAYHAAVYLYLIRSLLLSHFDCESVVLPGSATSTKQLYAEQTAKLRRVLDHLFATRNARVPFHTFTVWPIFMIGLLADPEDAETKRTARDRLTTVAIQCGTHSPIDASLFLARHWKRQQDAGDVMSDWDDLWREEEAPCVFII